MLLLLLETCTPVALVRWRQCENNQRTTGASA
jgi:hypothetical protein